MAMTRGMLKCIRMQLPFELEVLNLTIENPQQSPPQQKIEKICMEIDKIEKKSGIG